MVAGFQEDLDSEDEGDVFPPAPVKSPPTATTQSDGTKVSSYDVELSTDDDDDFGVMTKDEDVSDNDENNVWKTPSMRKEKSSGGIDNGLHLGMGLTKTGSSLAGLSLDSGVSSLSLSVGAVTVNHETPSTPTDDSSSTDAELPPGILGVSFSVSVSQCVWQEIEIL